VQVFVTDETAETAAASSDESSVQTETSADVVPDTEAASAETNTDTTTGSDSTASTETSDTDTAAPADASGEGITIISEDTYTYTGETTAYAETSATETAAETDPYAEDTSGDIYSGESTTDSAAASEETITDGVAASEEAITDGVAASEEAITDSAMVSEETITETAAEEDTLVELETITASDTTRYSLASDLENEEQALTGGLPFLVLSLPYEDLSITEGSVTVCDADGNMVATTDLTDGEEVTALDVTDEEAEAVQNKGWTDGCTRLLVILDEAPETNRSYTVTVSGQADTANGTVRLAIENVPVETGSCGLTLDSVSSVYDIASGAVLNGTVLFPDASDSQAAGYAALTVEPATAAIVTTELSVNADNEPEESFSAAITEGGTFTLTADFYSSEEGFLNGEEPVSTVRQDLVSQW